MHTDIAGLRRGFTGQILLPDEDGYDRARRVWNAMVDRRPAVIARCAGTSDVAAAVRFGRSGGLEIGVRGGGHNIAGLAVPEGGLMIDLSLMDAVRVDPGRRRARVQGGALLGALDRAAQSSGLATTAGNVSHTGVGGLTLGGGMGWLARQFGLACDNVASFEVVSADGEVLHASESQNPDLFWGLRGGGGNFGIVTEFDFRLHPAGTAALDRRPVLPAGRRAAGAAPMARPDPRRATPGNVHRLGRRRRRLAVPAARTARPAAGQRRIRVDRRPRRRPPAAPGAPRRHAAGSRADPGADLPAAAGHRRHLASPPPAAVLEGPLPARLRR